MRCRLIYREEVVCRLRAGCSHRHPTATHLPWARPQRDFLLLNSTVNRERERKGTDCRWGRSVAGLGDCKDDDNVGVVVIVIVVVGLDKKISKFLRKFPYRSRKCLFKIVLLTISHTHTHQKNSSHYFL